ncbi:MAG: NnrS family protein [Nitrospirota bacterium]|nr:NnrS family protein [Nitrospirota bacterium]
MSDAITQDTAYRGPAFWSYGFRPFFLSAALFAGIAIPVWALLLTGIEGLPLRYQLREWHVHEMIFGFLPCVITGFLLTAIPNWTERPPMRGWPLMLLWILWVAGRWSFAFPWGSPLIVALIDGTFLVLIAGIVWREILAAQVWDRLPIGVLISLYASANLLFHGLFLNGAETDLAERLGLTLIMLLLAMIGGKITPSFTEDYLEEIEVTKQPAPFSRFDGLAILLVAVAGVLWILDVNSTVIGVAFVTAGSLHLIRVSRWYGWLTWREPLVLILNVGYGWLAMAFLIFGGALLGIGVHAEEAIHVLTTGAVGVMTLAVMTRASLGHTGRTKHAGPLTVIIYFLVNLGALFRVFGPSLSLPDNLIFGLAAGCWSGAYVLFVVGYGPILFGPNRDE